MDGSGDIFHLLLVLLGEMNPSEKSLQIYFVLVLHREKRRERERERWQCILT
jgi:hypothetical protein